MERRALGLKWSLASHITGYSIVVFGQNSDLMLVDATGLVMCDFDDKHCWSFSISHNMGEVGGFGSMGVYVESWRTLSLLLIKNNWIKVRLIDILEYYC